MINSIIMTRRDYCYFCKKSTGDCGPTCVECGKDFCIDCPKVRTSLSRLNLLMAKVAIFSNMNVSRFDIECYIHDLQSYDVNFYMKHTYPYNEDDKNDSYGYNYVNEEFEKCKARMVEIFENYDEDNEMCYDEKSAKLFVELIKTLNDVLHEPFPFTCFICKRDD